MERRCFSIPFFIELLFLQFYQFSSDSIGLKSLPLLLFNFCLLLILSPCLRVHNFWCLRFLGRRPFRLTTFLILSLFLFLYNLFLPPLTFLTIKIVPLYPLRLRLSFFGNHPLTANQLPLSVILLRIQILHLSRFLRAIPDLLRNLLLANHHILIDILRLRLHCRGVHKFRIIIFILLRVRI